MKQLIMADNQDVTRIGFSQVVSSFLTTEPLIVNHKESLIEMLESHPNALVVLDYALFDIDIDTLLVLETRFSDSWWILFSSELSDQFIKQIYLQTQRMSVLFKDCSAEEIVVAYHDIQKGRRYISSSVSQALLESVSKQQLLADLTATEKQILTAIANGKTTKEIAGERYVSIHTVVAHRKNIFRKIQVNNMHEATKYAVKAGLIDLVDYFI